MFDLSCMNAPSNICDFFTKANSKHKHETRFSSSGNYYVQTSRLNLNQDSFSRFGAKLWNAIPNEFRQLSKGAFKKNFHDFLLSIMAAEDDYGHYVEAVSVKRRLRTRGKMQTAD